MTGSEDLTRAGGKLFAAEMIGVVMGLLIWLSRRKIRAAAGALREAEATEESLVETVTRLRSQLDGALEHIHDHPGRPVGIHGLPGDGPVDTHGSDPGDGNPGDPGEAA